jgi:hypothetical protein
MAELVPVYRFDDNTEAFYTVTAIGTFAASLYELKLIGLDGDTSMQVLHVALCAGALFFLLRYLPCIVHREFLRITGSGVIFHNLKEIPWQSVHKISLNEEGIVFLFDAPEAVRIPRKFFWYVREKAGLVLMTLRTEKISLDTPTLQIAADLQLKYAIYLEPSRGYGRDTPIEVIYKRIEEEKRGIRFFEKYEDILAAFNAQPDQ